jgi:hypothetical protein
VAEPVLSPRLDAGIRRRTFQAKGRVERSFGTAQDRWVKELRSAKGATYDEANAVLAKVVPAHNRQFAKAAREARDAHRKLGSLAPAVPFPRSRPEAWNAWNRVEYKDSVWTFGKKQFTIKKGNMETKLAYALDPRVRMRTGRSWASTSWRETS